ncbi:hypothetical protein BDW02DRAFT_599455 [Decorospora gaudefroyi]|uniref:Granulins domain-containing protein n=1 Tax=Decorospora gaudefroyi TaxID=184978 RepID=A0A6A5K6W0_9PLEO|nr:hypothetical protein BDW02DRAFT_599455 [Decorospora gaudefroyi]
MSSKTMVTLPKLFHIILLLVPFATGSLHNPFPATQPQSHPIPTNTTISSSLDKRLSCATPAQTCGTTGCYKPDESKCCDQHTGAFGLCPQDGICCGNYCCPTGTECYVVKGEGQGDGLWCWPPDLPVLPENIPKETVVRKQKAQKPHKPQKPQKTGRPKPRKKSSASRPPTPTYLDLLLLLVMCVVANIRLDPVIVESRPMDDMSTQLRPRTKTTGSSLSPAKSTLLAASSPVVPQTNDKSSNNGIRIGMPEKLVIGAPAPAARAESHVSGHQGGHGESDAAHLGGVGGGVGGLDGGDLHGGVAETAISEPF